MMLFRPAEPEDVAAITELASEAGTGLTTLSKDPSKIADRIELSINSFAKKVESPSTEYYFFVLENLSTGEIAGTSALAAAVGLEQPFYTYRLGTSTHSSRKLGVHKTVQTLVLGSDYTGTTEICTLFLSPKKRGSGAGKLLSKGRFLFMAQHPARFAKTVIAEMRGYSDEQGSSPFWESLGRKFFDIDFAEADTRSGEETNEFIAEMMPKHPIYVNLLPEKAQKVIGIVHPDTEPAIKLLQKEGFKYRGYVDIFDAGPTLEVGINNIDTIKKSFQAQLEIVSRVDSDQTYLLANSSIKNYRCTIANGVTAGETIQLTQEVADILQVSHGESLIASAL